LLDIVISISNAYSIHDVDVYHRLDILISKNTHTLNGFLHLHFV